MKYIFKQIDDISGHNAETTIEFSADSLPDILEHFEMFLRGSGFHPSGTLDFVNYDDCELEFSDDGIDAIANMASEVNNTVENIGARRLHTIIERILDDISFTATDRAGEKIIIDSAYVKQNLDELVKDTDLSKFIL